ncbi:hypothetical protein PVN32_22550 [Bacillus paralicheniformis]|uniref:Uncharacterized protein n=1 Tax=Bacillus paralicheniformis TaxID=1648923 RepID=A0AAW6KKE0_9BACI|nr:hypothetical protein [Bacillus paralicheniformis]MDE1383295.1 hypothetical protein [Bacillus paralicheniformis]MDE1454909.1 hypothetical protein [Bacillus paralicheniformis]
MDETKYLWKFGWRFGYGDVEGLFVATEAEVADLIGEVIDFGEILGKHNEIYGEVKEGEIRKVEIDPETVANVSAVLGDTWSGYNPLHYVWEDE